MSYATQKAELLQFFDDYVLKYLLSDLRVLDSIDADADGVGGCAVPQAISSFAAVDLFGFFLDPASGIPNMVKMKLKVFLKNENFFPDFRHISDLDAFLDSMRDDVRSLMTHRFFLVQYDIAKLPNQELFVDKAGKKVFNVRYFTRRLISAIEGLYQQIKADQFILAGDSTKEQTMTKLSDRLTALRTYEGDHFSAGSAQVTTSSTTTLETTQSLKR